MYKDLIQLEEKIRQALPRLAGKDNITLADVIEYFYGKHQIAFHIEWRYGSLQIYFRTRYHPWDVEKDLHEQTEALITFLNRLV